jgi:SAM-dependent methyltransferase
MIGGAGEIAETDRCGAALHATSVRHATPSVQQLVPSAARRQSRAPIFAGTQALISREECFARMLSRQRRPCAAPKTDAHYISVVREFTVPSCGGAAKWFTPRCAFAHNRCTTAVATGMQESYRRFYASATLQALFSRELSALAPILAGVYGNNGLFLRPHESVAPILPVHLVSHVVDVSPRDDGQFSGAARFDAAELPFVNDSFQLVIAQHAFELVNDVDDLASEVSRVLAPEGVLLVFGFNPLGSWRPWLMSQSMRGARLSLQSATATTLRFARQQIDTLQVRYPGLMLPNDPAQPPSSYTRWLAQTFGRFGSSWLLLARKRRSTLTPLRLRSSQRERALNPRLAPGAHRACA